MKVVQLEELLFVRHSVFIIGMAGTGKSQVWKTLFRTYQNQKKKPYITDLNPKAVSNDELYGIINPTTREWKDGLFSVIMRDQANITADGPKWIILDGDIDPMWIESLNTVMDDNKILTLASNERIALTSEMRLLFEISNLKHATPATVSRAGILYINPGDLGWNPYVTSWVETRSSSNEKAQLTILFDKYIPSIQEAMKHRFKKITPIPQITHIETLCQLLGCLIVPQNIPSDATKELYELYFVFALVWAYGSAIALEANVDHRTEFSKWFMTEFKTIEWPQEGTVFDFYVDEKRQELVSWNERVPKFELDPDVPLQAVLVHTGGKIIIMLQIFQSKIDFNLDISTETNENTKSYNFRNGSNQVFCRSVSRRTPSSDADWSCWKWQNGFDQRKARPPRRWVHRDQRSIQLLLQLGNAPKGDGKTVGKEVREELWTSRK